VLRDHGQGPTSTQVGALADAPYTKLWFTRYIEEERGFGSDRALIRITKAFSSGPDENFAVQVGGGEVVEGLLHAVERDLSGDEGTNVDLALSHQS
jgi:hypothetical protein